MWSGEKARKYLEVATNAAVILAALAAIFLAWNVYSSRHTSPQLRPGLEKGKTMASVRGLNYGEATQTLLVAMDTKCRYCAASVPFYNRLAELQQRNNKVRVLAVFPESEGEVNQYLLQKHVGLSAIAGVDFNTLNLAGTPTMILVDSRGKILDFWVGQLPSDAEQQVIERVGLTG